MQICFSLVLFRHLISDIEPLLRSIAELCGLQPHYDIYLCVYDGSDAKFSSPSAVEISAVATGATLVHCIGPNIGFGSANNHNFAASCLSDASLFIVVNPDISFSADCLVPLLSYAHTNRQVSCIAPLVVGSDGLIQYSAKRNPTFLSLLLGRLPFLRVFACLARYDSSHKNLSCSYETDCIYSPYLSGCFLIIPSVYFAAVGGFCSRYFLHLEDADIVRRLGAVGHTMHNPLGRVTHLWARGSHKSLRQTFYLLKSYFIYSSVWGFALY